MRLIMQLKNGTKGQGLVEYGLTLALVSVVAVGALNGVGNKVSSTFNKVGDAETLAKIEEGYIPVASAEELVAISDSANQNIQGEVTFGKGTEWENTFNGSDIGMGGKYVQVADIDLEGIGFEPIGPTKDNPFKGEYDGRGYVISNLTINKPSISHIGLFASTNGATLNHIRLTDVVVNGYNYVGGLVGDLRNNSRIIGSEVNGSVSSHGLYHIGGMVGLQYNSSIINSYSDVSVDGASDIGGLVGRHDGSSIINSHSSGSVVGRKNYAGGLVGRHDGNSVVRNSYSTSNVKGITGVGGLVGLLSGNSKVISSYTHQSVVGDNIVGGFIGEVRDGVIVDSGWVSDSRLDSVGLIKDPLSAEGLYEISESQFNNIIKEVILKYERVHE